jgi:hypothetical protein
MHVSGYTPCPDTLSKSSIYFFSWRLIRTNAYCTCHAPTCIQRPGGDLVDPVLESTTLRSSSRLFFLYAKENRTLVKRAASTPCPVWWLLDLHKTRILSCYKQFKTAACAAVEPTTDWGRTYARTLLKFCRVYFSSDSHIQIQVNSYTTHTSHITTM